MPIIETKDLTKVYGRFHLITSFLLFPISFLSGALFPMGRLPSWLATLTLADPVAYSVDALRSVILGTSQFHLILDILIISLFSILIIAIGSFAFEKMKL